MHAAQEENAVKTQCRTVRVWGDTAAHAGWSDCFGRGCGRYVVRGNCRQVPWHWIRCGPRSGLRSRCCPLDSCPSRGPGCKRAPAPWHPQAQHRAREKRWIARTSVFHSVTVCCSSSKKRRPTMFSSTASVPHGPGKMRGPVFLFSASLRSSAAVIIRGILPFAYSRVSVARGRWGLVMGGESAQREAAQQEAHNRRQHKPRRSTPKCSRLTGRGDRVPHSPAALPKALYDTTPRGVAYAFWPGLAQSGVGSHATRCCLMT